MKKLILACCALFVLGGGLAAGRLGGQAASCTVLIISGAFHSLRETLHIPHWREWWDEDGVRHSGFFHGALDEIRDEVRGHIDNAPEEGRPVPTLPCIPAAALAILFFTESPTRSFRSLTCRLTEIAVPSW